MQAWRSHVLADIAHGSAMPRLAEAPRVETRGYTIICRSATSFAYQLNSNLIDFRVQIYKLTYDC